MSHRTAIKQTPVMRKPTTATRPRLGGPLVKGIGGGKSMTKWNTSVNKPAVILPGRQR